MLLSFYDKTFCIAPNLLRNRPLITFPNSYHRLDTYRDSFTYMNYAEVLRERFFQDNPYDFSREARLGVSICAVLVAVKISCDHSHFRMVEFLRSFDLLSIPVKKLKHMERYFLCLINYDVRVDFPEIIKAKSYKLWEGSGTTPLSRIFSVRDDFLKKILNLFLKRVGNQVLAVHFGEGVEERVNTAMRYVNGCMRFTRKGLELAAVAIVTRKITHMTYSQLYEFYQLESCLCSYHFFRIITAYRYLERCNIIPELDELIIT